MYTIHVIDRFGDLYVIDAVAGARPPGVGQPLEFADRQLAEGYADRFVRPGVWRSVSVEPTQ